jgi:hypothetical protein
MIILIATLLAAVAAIALSEVLGRGKVVYTRMLSLIIAYASSCAIAGLIVIRYGGRWSDAVALALSVVPLMAAWLGLRIHLSNSVTLEMVTLLNDRGPLSTEALATAYDPQGHAARRIEVLREAGYLIGDDDRVAATFKGRAMLLLIRMLCGRDGPRAVVAMLRRAGARPR